MLFLTLFQYSTTARAATIMYWLNYQPFRDEYRLDFTWPTGTTSYKLLFLSPSGDPYELAFNAAPTGILYLTCNGTYGVDFYGAGGSRIGYFENIETTAIAAPTCSSYPDQTGTNGLNASAADNGDGSYDLNWDAAPGASKYEVWKDGVKIGETTGTNYTVPSSGAVSVVARDAQGNIIEQSDMHVPTLTDVDNEPDPGGGETCDMCAKLADALACPEWDTYMGELTGAIKAALPTLPEWRTIADQFVDAFDEYFGEVPVPPTVEQITENVTPQLPTIDTSVPDANIAPDVPDAFDDPIDFDITEGEEIPLVDGSQPIEIYEPDKYINSDEPGTMVFPGDPRNTSDGIKNPESPVPIGGSPTPTPSEPGEIEPSDMPIPTGPTSTDPEPTPADPGGVVPIPAAIQ